MLDRIFRFEALLPIMTPVLLIGGMTTGLFTPTEGAIAACVWAMILGFAWYRTLNWKMFVKVCLDTVETTSTVLFIVAAASIFGWMLTATGVTADIAAWVLAFTKEAWVFLLLANLLMLFVGCFLEPTAAITILVPILLPIAVQLGIDPIHFGLVMVLNLMIGLLHPPMGMVLFVLARVAGLSFERTTMAILPWLVPLLVSLVIITYVPKPRALAAEDVLLTGAAPRLLAAPLLLFLELAPVAELVLVDLDVELGDARAEPLLDVGDGAVVDRRADLLEQEAEQRAGGDVADALVALLLEPALDRLDRLLAGFLRQLDRHAADARRDRSTDRAPRPR